MYKGFLITHQIVVTLFFLIYVIKTVLLLSNKQELLQRFTKIMKVPEMIVSAAFLVTGVYMLTQLPVIKPIMWVKIALVFTSIPVAIVGFKKNNKILAALSLLMITASYGLAEMSRKQKVITDIQINGAIVDGKQLYDANCAICHGNDGKLGMAGAFDLTKTNMAPATISQTILNGKGVMPKQEMSNEQAAAIADYVSVNIKGK